MLNVSMLCVRFNIRSLVLMFLCVSLGFVRLVWFLDRIACLGFEDRGHHHSYDLLIYCITSCLCFMLFFKSLLFIIIAIQCL